jgi:sterol desaturase/sphingolipid hydroxylase (fatty acid hydroxylase superfamily)
MPGEVSLPLGDFLVAHGDDLQFALFFGLFAILAAAEAWRPRLERPPARRLRWPANLGLTALNALLPPLVPVTAIGVAMWVDREGIGLLQAVAAPLTVAIAATLVIRSFVSYATHVLLHRSPLLWRLHRVHHSDPHLDVSSTVRFHPLEFLVQLGLLVPAVAVFGLMPWALVLYELLDVVVNVFSHANVRVPSSVERSLRWVVVTPDVHRIHHSSWQPETDSNFGPVFTIWDRAFGTYRDAPRAGYDNLEIGLTDLRGAKAAAFWWQVRSPIVRDYSDRPAARTALEAISRSRSEEDGQTVPARR